jgi:hypothetical protein
MDCEESFNYARFSELLDRMLSDVEAECHRHGMGTHWSLFRERVLLPVLEGQSPPPLAQLCRKHGIAKTTKAAQMIYSVKRRFRAALRQYIRQSVVSEGEVDDEIFELMQFLREKPNDIG